MLVEQVAGELHMAIGTLLAYVAQWALSGCLWQQATECTLLSIASRIARMVAKQRATAPRKMLTMAPPPATSRLLHTHGTAHAWRGSLVTPLGSFATLRSRRLVYCRQAMMAKLQTQQHHGVRHFSDEHERQHIGWLNRHFLHNNGFNSDITRPHLTFSPWTSSSP